MYLFLSMLCWFVTGAICSRVARQRGRHSTLWFFLGFVLGVIGIIILYILPSKKQAVAVASPVPNTQPIEINVTPTEPEAPVETTILWYYLDEANKQYGPMSFSALQGAWDDDQITSSTYVWNEQMENWLTLEDLPELLAKIRRTPDPE